MKRLVISVPLMLAGCSTAPIADLLDFVKPGRIGPGPYHGGVINQHAPPPGPMVPALDPAAPPSVPPPPETPIR